MSQSRSRRPLLAAALILLAVLGIAAPAQAAGTPNISVSAGPPQEILYGDQATVTLTAANPAGQPPGYNLSLRAVLPAGVTFVPGSGPAGVPATVVPNQPVAGQQTVVFSNVSDLSANSSSAVSFKVAHTTTAPNVVGSTFTVTGEAYVNSDPRHVPQFNAAGQAVGGSHTGNASTTHPVKLLPFRVVREAPDNQLRGAHDFQYRTRITIENNKVGATNGFTLTDYVPAGVEVLACGAGDNTGAEEYPGSGPLNPGNAPSLSGCVAPTTVETVTVDPDGAGPLPTGVYTRQTWTGLGNLAANGTRVLEFATAIPIRENEEAFSGATPTPASGEQAANLRNNGGDETYDEQPLRSYAQASGTYAGVTHQAGDEQTTVAEDLTLGKSASSGTIAIGATTQWTLTARASEYRWVDDTVIVDTVPDGLCVLGAADYDADSADCGQVIGADPYSNVAENPDGTWTVTFDPLPRIAPGGSQSVVLTTRTRTHYQENGADAGEVLANDDWTNVADVSGRDYVICTGGSGLTDCAGGTKIDHDETDGVVDVDGAWARQIAASPSLAKQVASSGSAGSCLAATYQNGTASGYGPGDRVCWKVRMEFPGGTPTGGVSLTDFLPIGHDYEGGSFAVTPANDIPQTIDVSEAADGVLTWDLGTSHVANQNAVFEGVLATRIREQASPAFPGQLTQNLLKASTTNTPEISFPLRADAGATMEAPVVALDKSVADVDNAAPSGSPPNVRPNDVVTYRVRVTNSGARTAQSVEVWDQLDPGITCAMTGSFSLAPDSCAAGLIKWTVPAIAAAGGVNLDYDVTIPSTGSGQTFTNAAGVRSYESATNDGAPNAEYFPLSNVDPTVPAQDQNAAAAEDTQSVRTALITVTKGRTTEVTAETGNDTNVATIGELVHYTVSFTVPEDTILYGAQLNDTFVRHTIVPGTIAATMNGGALPGGVSVAQNGNGVRLTFPGTYTAAANETFAVTFSAQVDDVAANVRTASLSNQATLTYNTTSGGGAQTRSGSITTTIVEPNLDVAKASHDLDGIVEPGDDVRYTVTATNTAAPSVSTAHQVDLVDTVPLGITPLTGSGGATVDDGDTVGPHGGVWDETARTITWPAIATLAPGASQTRDYHARVDDPATGQARLINSVRGDTSSLAAAQEAGGERTDAASLPGYADTATATLDIIGLDIAKAMTPATQTVGGVVTGTLTVTVPASVATIDAFVTDLLPDGLVFDEYVSATCTSGCAGAPIPVATLPTEDAGSGRTRLGWWIGDQAFHTQPRVLQLVYRAYVENDRVAGQTLTNSAQWHLNRTQQVGGTPAGIPGGSDVTSTSVTDTTTVAEPAITLDKDVSGDPDDDDARATQPGDTFTYELVVENTGDHPAYDVTVSDQPGPQLVDVVPAANPAASVTDGWTAGDPDMAWTIPGPIAPGGSVTLEYTAALAPSAQLDPAADVVNTADVPSFWGVASAERTANGFPYREYTAVPADTVTLDLDTPQVTVAKAATGGASAHVLQPYAWTITVANTAPHAGAHGAVVTDRLPRNWTYDAGSATVDGVAAEPAVTTDPAGDVLTWTGIDVPAGGDVEIALTATPRLAGALDPGHGPGHPHENRAAVTGVEDATGATADAVGSYSPAGPATADTLLLIPDADLEAVKTTTTAPVAGGAVAWRVVVTNHGPDGSPAAALTDVVPAGVTVTAATTTQGTCDITGAPTVTCAFGELEVGDSATVEITGTVADAASAGATLGNTATASDVAIDDPVPGNDSDSTSDTVLERAALTLDKERLDPLVTSREARWRLTLANGGPSVARDAEIVDTLPAGLTYASGSAGCGEAAGVVTCAVGDLAPGATASVEIVTTVGATAGTLTNAAVGRSTTPAADGGAPNEVTATADGPVVRPDLAITEFVEGTPVTGGTLSHGFVVTNAGGAATYGPTTVTMSYPAGLVPQSVSGTGWTCRISGQTVTCTRPDSIAAGAGFPGIYVRSRVTAAAGTALVVRSHVGTPGDTDAGNDDAQAGVIAAAVPDAAPSCAGGGRLSVAQTRLWAGARARVTGRVASRGGQVVAGQLVRLQGRGGVRSVRTDARGRYAFPVHPAAGGARYTISVPGCGMRKAISARRADSCRSLSVGRASLQAGEAARLRIRLRAGGRPLSGVRVKVRGAGVKATVRTNRSGRASVRVRPARAGIVAVAAPAAVRCTRRVGVVAQDTAAQLTG